MATVPTYFSRENLKPAELDPNVASGGGKQLSNLGEGLSAIGDTVQKLDNKRQTLKAQTAVAQQHIKIAQMAATDPNIDTLNERVDQMSEDAVSHAAEMIKSSEARQDFVAKANLDIERRNAAVYNTILRRKSQDFKNSLVEANDADIQDYQNSANPKERQLIRQNILDRTNEAINDGHVNADWGKVHATTLLKSADMNQVKSDMAINATATYEQLQKGKDGLYPYLNEGQRKKFADQAQKMVTKEGSDNKLIYGIAQNHAESQLVDKMGDGSLTQMDLNNASTVGLNGIKARPEFVKAAREALDDPFPTESAPDKYNKLVQDIQNPSVDPMTMKLNILNARGLTPQEKSHLINAHLREDTQDGKQSINDLIQQGIKQNKQKLMQADKNLQTEIASRQTFFSKITERFRDHAKDDSHLAGLQKEYMSRLQDTKDDQERLQLAQEIMNKDTLKRNPGIATANAKGTVFIDKTTGAKRRYFPSGFWEPVKTADE